MNMTFSYGFHTIIVTDYPLVCVAVVALSLVTLLLCFITFIAFLLSSCVCQLLIKFMMMMMMMISKSKSCYITSSRNDYYSTHHNSLYMPLPLPDLDSRLAYPRPRPRPRLKTYKTNTGDVEYDYWGDDWRRRQGSGRTVARRRFQGRDDAVASRPGGGRHFSSNTLVQRNH